MSHTSASARRPPRVFISYSHDSAEHRECVLELSDRLRADGVDACLDQYEVSPPEGWPRWMRARIREADFVLVVCTETYARRYEGREEIETGLGASWEGAVLTQELYDAAVHNTKLIPVFFSDTDADYIPIELRATTRYSVQGQEGYEGLYRRLTNQPKVHKPKLGKLQSMPARERRLPKYQSEEIRLFSMAIEEAYLRREKLQSASKDTTAVDAEILKLRRRLREGAQLKAGDFLLEGRFKLIEILGRGGFATVWKAYDRGTRDLVAIKVLHGQFAEDRSRRNRFFRGARKMAELQHQGVVRVIEPELVDGDWYFFVMEYIVGGDFRQAVLAKALSQQERLRVILKVGEALEFAHQRGVIHRDVKPSNILLDESGQPKLTDFDLVHAFDTTGGTPTQGMMGTYIFASPESLHTPKDVTPASDVFSLGMTTIFALNGSELPLEVLRNPKGFVGQLNCPTAIKEVSATAVSWTVKRRYGTVSEFRGALEGALLPRLESGRRGNKEWIVAIASIFSVFILIWSLRARSPAISSRPQIEKEDLRLDVRKPSVGFGVSAVRTKPDRRMASLHTDAFGELVPVIVVVEGAQVLSDPAQGAEMLRRAQYLEQYFLLDVVSEGGRKYLLAATMDVASRQPADLVGWFDARDVLTEREALKDKPGIYLKGLIINQWRDAFDRGVRIEGASAFDGPGHKTKRGVPYKEVAELGLFSFYFVYARHEAPDGSLFYLLGNTSIMLDVTRPKETLVGWVAGKQVYEWSTRQAVQFDKNSLEARVRQLPAGSRGGAKIFKTRRELMAHLRVGENFGSGEPFEPVAVEDTRVKQWQHNWQRFPILAVEHNDALPNTGRLFKVGYVGDQIYLNYSDSLRGKDYLLQRLRNIDILFVVESAGSMKNYFRAAASAATSIVSLFMNSYPSGKDSPDIRISVLLYRGYADDGSAVQTSERYLTKRLPLSSNIGAVEEFLRSEERLICQNCDGDKGEAAVFHAVTSAIASASREVREVGLRSLVLIGNKGNHVPDPRGYTARKVADSLIAQDYDFFCIHAASLGQISEDSVARAFRDQCDEIERLVQVNSAVNPIKVQTEDPTQIALAILDAAKLVVEDLEEARGALAAIGRGEAGLKDIKIQYGVRLTRRLSAMLVERGIDPRIFVEKSVQLYDEGWVAERDPFSGERQIETVLLVERTTLEQLMAVLAGFIKKPPSSANVVTIWPKVLNDLTAGAFDTKKTVAENIESHLGLPVHTKLLHRTLEQISQLSPEDLAELWSQMDLDLHRLRGIYWETELILSKKPRPTGGFEVVVQEAGTRAVWWQGRGREYAWIATEALP